MRCREPSGSQPGWSAPARQPSPRAHPSGIARYLSANSRWLHFRSLQAGSDHACHRRIQTHRQKADQPAPVLRDNAKAAHDPQASVPAPDGVEREDRSATWLRTDLLFRHRQGLEPTPAGHALLLHCHAILGRVDQLFADVSEYGDGMRGLIRLAANESAAIGYLPTDIARFLTDAPSVKVDVQVLTSPAVIRMVLDNACDAGIFTGDVPT